MSDAARLALYRQAEEDILLYGQSNAVPGRSFQRADLERVQRLIRELEQRVARANSGPVLLRKGHL